MNFGEGIVLTRFTTRVITRDVLHLFFLQLLQINYFQNTGFRYSFSKYRLFTGLCWISSKIPARPV